jgi:hypothetical protein
MLGFGWKPAQATVVDKRFIQENVGAFFEYVLDVQPVDGGPAFRTTLKQQAYMAGDPEAGQVVQAFWKPGTQAVKFDRGNLQRQVITDPNAQPPTSLPVSAAGRRDQLRPITAVDTLQHNQTATPPVYGSPAGSGKLLDGPEHGYRDGTTLCGIPGQQIFVMRHMFDPHAPSACPVCAAAAG